MSTMQQQTGFVIEDNEAFIDWQKIFSEDTNFSDLENDFIQQRAISREDEMGLFPMNSDKTCNNRYVLHNTETQPGRNCKNTLHKMQSSIETAVFRRSVLPNSSSSENCCASHLNCKHSEILPENVYSPNAGKFHLKTHKECSCASSFLDSELIINGGERNQGLVSINNPDILKMQCESASEMGISSQGSSNSQSIPSQLSSTEEMAVSSQESIASHLSDKMNISQEKEAMVVSSQESIASHSSDKMNISQEKEAMVVSSQEILADSSIDKKMNILQEKVNPKTSIVGQEICEIPEDVSIKVGQCSFLTRSLIKTLSKNTSHMLHLGNFDKMELFKHATNSKNISCLRKIRKRYSKTLKGNRYSNIARREQRVMKREAAVHIRQKLLAIKEANLLRREKILKAKEKKYCIYKETV